MPLPTADQIVTQQHKRYFYQLRGAAPNNPVKYGGLDGQYLTIESGDLPQGEGSPINVSDPSQFKRYRQVGEEIAAPDFDTYTVSFLQNHGGVPRQLYNIADCVTTFFEVTGTCKDPSVLTRKMTDYVKIYASGKPNSIAAGGGSFDGDSMVQDDLDSRALGGIYPVGALSVGAEASSEIYSEVVDAVYGSKIQCGQCGPNDDGTQRVYWVINNTVASPGVGPAVGYTLDGFGSQAIVAISGATSNDIPVAIDVVGQYLVVAYRNATTGGYFYSLINSITGIPGAWTNVTTGFVSGAQPLDMYVANPREIYFCGNGGYVYKSTNILSGVTAINAGATTTDNLNRIDGIASTVVAVGDGGAVIYSLNRGGAFSVTTYAPALFSIDALEVLDDFLWIVGGAGANGGSYFYNNTQGQAAWVQVVLPALIGGTPTAIIDIFYPTPEVGYIVAIASGPTALFYATITGGAEWEDGSVNTFPTIDRVNRLAAPSVENRAVASNNLALAGLAGNGSDGVLLIGGAEIVG